MLPSRITYVLKIFPKLSETFIAGELAELRRRGVELQILSLLPPREERQHEFIARAGLERLACYEPGRFPDAVAAFRPQLLHAHFATEAAAVARDLAASHRLPFTFTAHGYDIFRKPPPDFGARAAAAAAVITVSQANAAYIQHAFGVSRSRLRVVGSGVDTDLFRPGNGAVAKVEAPWVVCVARHVAVKNLPLLLRGCARLRDWKVDFRCALVGDGPCRGELESLRAALGLEPLVQMPGAAEQLEVLRWWQRAAIGVLSSDHEGLPVSLMEAAACGVPVVATAVGGVPELVLDGLTGLLTPGGDAEALALEVKRLLEDRDLRHRMGRAARQRAEEHFCLARQVGHLLELWSQILDGAAS